jgi:HAD superfamily hydrolase (TIGR01549 family)
LSHRFLALCFDFGDTLINQATEVKDESFTTLHAELIPGVVELLHELKRRGYRLGLVSNGPIGSIPNVLGAYGLYELFDVLAISQGLGVEKPDAGIFRYALNHLGIPQSEYERTIMVGNDLTADVAGANTVGMISVWLDWAPRHRKTPMSEAEIPRYTIAEPLALLSLLEELERRPGPLASATI